MSQTGYTPIQLYRSSTAAAAPSAGSLADGELALNTTDEKLYFKNASGTVKLLASSAGASGTVTSVAATGGTGISVTGSPITSSGTLTITNTAPDQVVSLTGAGTTTVTGTYPNFTITSNDQYAGTVTSVAASGGTTGLTFSGGPITTSGTLTLGGTLAVANGGTGATSLTSGYLVKGNGTSAATASVVYDNGTNVGIGTSSPSYKLDVAGDVSIDNGGAIVGKNTTGGDAQLLYWSATSGVSVYGRNTLGGSVTQHDFRTAGATRLTIDNSGNVGIGTTSLSAKFSVAGRADFGISTDALVYLTYAANAVRGVLDVGTSDFSIYASGGSVPLILGTAGSERMRIDSSGNVGIGTSAAYGGRVNVVPASTPTTVAGANQVQIGEATANTGYRLQLGYLNDATAGYVSSVQSYGGGSAAALILNGAGGNVGIGTSSPSGRLHVAGSGDITAYITTSSSGGSNLGLSVTSAGAGEINMINGFPLIFKTSNTERARIDSSGNVGIGTTSPGSPLDVVTNSSALGIAIRGRSSDNVGSLALRSNDGATIYGQVQGRSTDFRLEAGSSNVLTAYTNASERMRINSSGNVGIGTSSPGQKLTVVGTIESTSGGFKFPDGTTQTTAASGDVTLTGTQTLTNKRITPRVSSTTSVTSPLAINSDSFDQYAVTAQSTNFTISADAGTPTDGQKLIFRIQDNGTTRTITFTGGVSKGFQPVGVTLTASSSNWTYTTVAGKIAYFGCIYNAAASRWDIIALSKEA